MSRVVCAVSFDEDIDADENGIEEVSTRPNPAPTVFRSMREVEEFWNEQARYVSDVCSIDDGYARQLLKEHGHDTDAAIQDFLVNVRIPGSAPWGEIVLFTSGLAPTTFPCMHVILAYMEQQMSMPIAP